jgi:hypothetical protein
MNKRIKHLTVVAALCGIASMMSAGTASAMKAGDSPTMTRLAYADPPGLDVHLSLEQKRGAVSYWCDEHSWHEILLAGANAFQTSFYPPGPEADQYLQHYHGTPSFQYAERYWREFMRAEGDLSSGLYPPGPEADLYLEHYKGTPSYRYGIAFLGKP